MSQLIPIILFYVLEIKNKVFIYFRDLDTFYSVGGRGRMFVRAWKFSTPTLLEVVKVTLFLGFVDYVYNLLSRSGLFLHFPNSFCGTGVVSYMGSWCSLFSRH